MRELYQDKIKILREVLTLTKDADFKDNSGDADVYIDLIEKRDVLLGRAKTIDSELTMAGITGKEPEAKEYIAEIIALAGQIIEQDGYMKEHVTKLHANAKTDVKNINTGKSLNNIYHHTVSDSSVIGRDWSQ